jgi:hypothetical protein
MGKVLDRQLVIGAGAFGLVDGEVAAIVRDRAANVEFLVVGAVEDKFVFRLRGAELVEVKFVEVVGGLKELGLVRFIGRSIGGVEEARVVVGPTGVRELGPLDGVGQIA